MNATGGVKGSGKTVILTGVRHGGVRPTLSGACQPMIGLYSSTAVMATSTSMSSSRIDMSGTWCEYVWSVNVWGVKTE